MKFSKWDSKSIVSHARSICDRLLGEGETTVDNLIVEGEDLAQLFVELDRRIRGGYEVQWSNAGSRISVSEEANAEVAR